MRSIDYHMHTRFSGDSEADPREHVIQAIKMGLDEICFTDHRDFDYPIDVFDLDVEGYYQTIMALKKEFADKIIIKWGIEIGLDMNHQLEINNLINQYPFDFVIGSSHVVHGCDPYYGEFFKNRRESDCYREYFESILENLRVFSDIDVYGHIDYIVRYGPNQNRDYSYEGYQDVLDEILRTLIHKNTGIEINTGGYHYGLGEPNPCTAVIRRYRELGGEIITIGADAHSPDKIAFAFDKAAAVLKDCGFRYYTIFKGRKPEFIRL